jgi:hypothetical protein
MSALPPKADIAGYSSDVRFVPKADSCTAQKRDQSITSSAVASSDCGTVRPSALAIVPEVINRRLRISKLSGDVQELARQVRNCVGKAGDVATRMREVRYQSYPDGIAHVDEDDWDR